jgi:hypothetical protein
MDSVTYQDKHGRLHDKPCINGEPSSNNGWIYTAYLNKLKPVNLLKEQTTACFNRCLVNGKFLLRSPGKELPPMSRDEILGTAALKLLKPEHLQGWSFSPKPIPKFNISKLASQLWQLRPTLSKQTTKDTIVLKKLYIRHRNYFWENNLDQLYRFSYSVPLTDRNFIQQTWGKFNPIYWAIAKVDSWIGKGSGIKWLKYDKTLEGMRKEFPAGHPLVLTNPQPSV